MTNNDLKLLDCTLRDGGYVNQWNWGFDNARAIISILSKAGIDFVEVGFLRNVDAYDSAITVCNTIEELNRLLPDDCGKTIYSAMAMQSNYDISKLSPYSGKGIEMIRITAHDYDIEAGMKFAKSAKDKGYKISINPINIMGYTDERLLWLISQANQIMPYQFSIVDTFGSMKRRDLDRIVSIVDNNLNRDIRVALHLHENMSLSCCLAQQFVDKHLNRPVAIDGSLLGMGRIPGNLPIELISDYLNDYAEKNYDIDYLMDAIQDYIAPIKGASNWGYSPAFFLSAKYNLHRNYAEYYLSKGDLTNRDINHILATYERDKATVFDKEYADRKYAEYKNVSIDDARNIEYLREFVSGRLILLLAPGNSINEKKDAISKYIAEKEPIVISINFVSEEYKCDFAFFSNSKRFSQLSNTSNLVVVTSNIEVEQRENVLCINYNRLSGVTDIEGNSYIMILKLLLNLGVSSVAVAGADGFKDGERNYYKSSIKNMAELDSNYNELMRNMVKSIGMSVQYITYSPYE